MSKKLLSLILVLALLLSISLAITACKKTDPTPTDTGYPIPQDIVVNIEIYNGDTLLGTITKDILLSIAQEKIAMSTTNSMGTASETIYVGYSVEAAVQKLGITLPAITTITAVATDGYIDTYEMQSLANAYISIGFEENGEFAADGKAPRFISDKTSKSSKSVAKFISKVIINPTTDDTNGDNNGDNGGDNGGENNVVFSLSYTMTPVWSDNGRTLTITFEDKAAAKTNTIVFSTPDTENAITQITADGKAVQGLTANLLVSKTKKTTTYIGYNLKDLIAYMGKLKKDDSWMSFVADYAEIRFACSDDAVDTSYTERAYTKAETNGDKGVVVVADGDGTRILSDLDDTNPSTYRNNLKKVIRLDIYTAESNA